MFFTILFANYTLNRSVLIILGPQKSGVTWKLCEYRPVIIAAAFEWYFRRKKQKRQQEIAKLK